MNMMIKDPRKTGSAPVPLNGVDMPVLLATIDAVGGKPELARFQFRARNHWLSGAHSQSTMSGFFGGGVEYRHLAPYKAQSDYPAVLCGGDAGPTPVEWVLHALASCLTAGIVNIAAAQGIKLRKVESTVEGDVDLRVTLGLSEEVRNGLQDIKICFDIEGDASPEQLEQIVMRSQARSAVFNIVTSGVPVSIAVK